MINNIDDHLLIIDQEWPKDVRQRQGGTIIVAFPGKQALDKVKIILIIYCY